MSSDLLSDTSPTYNPDTNCRAHTCCKKQLAERVGCTHVPPFASVATHKMLQAYLELGWSGWCIGWQASFHVPLSPESPLGLHSTASALLKGQTQRRYPQALGAHQVYHTCTAALKSALLNSALQHVANGCRHYNICEMKACFTEDTKGQVAAVTTWSLCAGQMLDTRSKLRYAACVRAIWQGHMVDIQAQDKIDCIHADTHTPTNTCKSHIHACTYPSAHAECYLQWLHCHSLQEVAHAALPKARPSLLHMSSCGQRAHSTQSPHCESQTPHVVC